MLHSSNIVTYLPTNWGFHLNNYSKHNSYELPQPTQDQPSNNVASGDILIDTSSEEEGDSYDNEDADDKDGDHNDNIDDRVNTIKLNDNWNENGDDDNIEEDDND